MEQRQQEGPPARDARAEVTVEIGPGLLRSGRVVRRDGGLLVAEFRANEPHYAPVGSELPIQEGTGLRQPSMVVARFDRGTHRLYAFRVERDPPAPPPTEHDLVALRATFGAHRTSQAPLAGAVELAFGSFVANARLRWIDGERIAVTVPIPDESRLAAIDLVELRAPDRARSSPVRICGWIRERLLEPHVVLLVIEGERRLTERFEDELRRLRRIEDREESA